MLSLGSEIQKLKFFFIVYAARKLFGSFSKNLQSCTGYSSGHVPDQVVYATVMGNALMLSQAKSQCCFQLVFAQCYHVPKDKCYKLKIINRKCKYLSKVKGEIFIIALKKLNSLVDTITA